MRLSKTELELLKQVSLGKSKTSEIAQALKKDVSQVYRITRGLKKKGFTTLQKGIVTPSETTHVRLILQVLSEYSSIIEPLSGCGLDLFTSILKPNSIDEIITQTGIKRSTIFYKLKQAISISLINRRENKYLFNEKIWPKAKEFLLELKKYEETTDKRVPPGSIIYYKNKKEIVFSTKIECDATLTGFSAYGQYGLKLLTVDYNYYLPKKNLTKKEVFLHSIYRAQKQKDARDIIFIALFYLKYKKYLIDIRHEIIDNINKVMQGEKIKYYPSLVEIKDRADVYDIKI